MYYNSFQYSFRIWLTTALAVPHVYILYFFASRGITAYLPLWGYLILLFESLLVSVPVWFVFFMALNMICKINTCLIVKKLIAWGTLEVLLFLLFAILIYGSGDRGTSWSSCFELLVIGSVAIAVSIFLFPLRPLRNKEGAFQIFKPGF
jgi:hypothetical protein